MSRITKFMKYPTYDDARSVDLDRLRDVLHWPRKPLPNLRHVCPNLSYGRHDGPPCQNARNAAVLVHLFLDHTRTWQVTLIERGRYDGIHSGEIALPGGRSHPSEAAMDTALREFHEETGHRVENGFVLGEIPGTYVFASRHWVRTFLAVELSPPRWEPDPGEVAAMLELPVEEFWNPANYGVLKRRRKQVRFSAPCFNFAGHKVWGATFRILRNFFESLSSIR